MINAFCYGVVLALGLILPLGIQNIFVFNQGATQRQFIHSLPAVLTAFLCDSLLILFSVLGISMAVLTIPKLKTFIFCFGIVFLLYMGWNVWNSARSKDEAGEPFS